MGTSRGIAPIINQLGETIDLLNAHLGENPTDSLSRAKRDSFIRIREAMEILDDVPETEEVAAAAAGDWSLRVDDEDIGTEPILNLIAGSGIIIVGTDDPANTEVEAEISSPWNPGDIEGRGCIVGGVLSLTAGTSGLGVVKTPFSYSGSPPTGRNIPFPMPAGAWVFNSAIMQGTTDTSGATIQGGISKNATTAPVITAVTWDMCIKGLSVGPAAYHGERGWPTRFEIGESLQHFTQNHGPSSLNALYNAWAMECVVDGGGWILGTTTTAQAGGATTYQSIFGGVGGVAGELSHRAPLPAGSLIAGYIRLSGAQSAAFSTTYTLYKNGVATAFTVTIPAGAAAGYGREITFSAIAYADGDTISLEEVSGAGAGNAGQAAIAIHYRPTVVDSAIIGWQCGRSACGATPQYLMPWLRRQSSTEPPHTFPLPRGGSLVGTDCRLFVVTTPGETKTIKVRKNGADSGVQWSIGTGTAAESVVIGTGEATFERGDYIDLLDGADGGGFGDWSDATIMLRYVED